MRSNSGISASLQGWPSGYAAPALVQGSRVVQRKFTTDAQLHNRFDFARVGNGSGNGRARDIVAVADVCRDDDAREARADVLVILPSQGRQDISRYRLECAGGEGSALQGGRAKSQRARSSNNS
jgi:hypothetical protein